MRYGEVVPQGDLLDHWELVHDYTVAGSAITTYTISSLTGDTHEVYRLFLNIINDHAGSSNVYVRFNADNGANYGFSYLRSGSPVTCAVFTGQSQLLIGGADAVGDVCYSENTIYATSGYARLLNQERITESGTTTVNNMLNLHGVWSNTADELTSITIYDGASNNGLGIDSRFLLYGKVQ